MFATGKILSALCTGFRDLIKILGIGTHYYLSYNTEQKKRLLH